MIGVQDKLAARIEAAIGTANVNATPGLELDGLTPELIARPSSPDEVAECVRLASETDAAIIPSGFGTWLESGNVLRRADLILSLERMNQVEDYSPPDLTITVGPGLSLDDLNRVAADSGQWLPLDPPGTGNRSIGSIVSCATSGTLRPGFGTPRDYVIGLGLTHPDGSISKSGGRVVKNVAGYDMNKLYVGSFGTLAIISQVRLKLRPLPEHDCTLLLTADEPDSLFEVARSVVTTLKPVSQIMINPQLASSLSALRLPGSILISDAPVTVSRHALLIRFMESEKAVEYQMERTARLLNSKIDQIPMEPPHANDIWRRLVDLDQSAEICVRVSVRPAETSRWFDLIGRTLPQSYIAADTITGLIRVAFSAAGEGAISTIGALRRDIETDAHGTLFIERAATGIRRAAGAWGDPGPSGPLMVSLKDKMDPRRILNPGRYVCGI